MKKTTAQNTLAIVWGGFFLIILPWSVLWAVNSYFSEKTKDIVNWVTQSSLPYILLILTVYFSSKKSTKIQYTDRWAFVLALVLSLAYIFFVLGVCYALAKAQFLSQNPMKVIENTNMFSTFFQVALSLVFGFYFANSAKK
ncbi:hypothetical protein LX99_02173 [Mucilaginibacter oryzae]|uniref:Uncharacterized protein n=1 Tax=Mucilaginibacter oryzae TaxID=468058 RepID=A0A316HE70_9SPHI|nr:hypothetical protein [Mucilaginibacter oryzae]PWK78331.1 hypothetical protein LX99_02173 [Mucilaginibacter oryzae]